MKENIVKRLGTFVAATVFLSSGMIFGSCQELFQKEGNPQACERWQHGENLCPQQKNSIGDAKAYRYIYYGRWKRLQGVSYRTRLVVIADPDALTYTYETDPAELGESYVFALTPYWIGSDHMIDSYLHCRALKNGSYLCAGDVRYRNVHVEYRSGDKGFDLRFRYESFEDSKHRWESSVLRLRGDSVSVHEEYYDRGRKRKDLEGMTRVSKVEKIPL